MVASWSLAAQSRQGSGTTRAGVSLDQEWGLAKGCSLGLLREESLLGVSTCPTLCVLRSPRDPRHTFRGGMSILTLPQCSAAPSSCQLHPAPWDDGCPCLV